MPSPNDATGRLDAAAVLGEPVTLPCGAELPNRIAKSAMSEQLGTVANAPDARLARLYEHFGGSGAGLIVTGNVMIDRRHLGEPLNVVLDGPDHREDFRRWAEAGQVYGAHVWMQINHPGRQVPRSLAAHPVAPSAVRVRVGRGVFGTPLALREDEILEILVRFGRTAGLAREAGFDGVQIHGAHGYLVSQFLSSRTNRRDDRWGGSLENRMRFARDVVREVRRVVGDDFPVGFKVNCSDFVRGGFSAEEALAVARMLDAEGVDLIEVSGGSFESTAMVQRHRPRDAAHEAFFLDVARGMKVAVKTRVMLTGGNRTAGAMASAVLDGGIDVVGVGRPLLVQPAFAAALLSGDDPGALARPRSLGAKPVDAFVSISWHERQMRRLASGRRPAPHMSSLAALAFGLRRNTVGASRVRRRRRRDGIE